MQPRRLVTIALASPAAGASIALITSPAAGVRQFAGSGFDAAVSGGDDRTGSLIGDLTGCIAVARAEPPP